MPPGPHIDVDVAIAVLEGSAILFLTLLVLLQGMATEEWALDHRLQADQ